MTSLIPTPLRFTIYSLTKVILDRTKYSTVALQPPGHFTLIIPASTSSAGPSSTPRSSFRSGSIYWKCGKSAMLLYTPQYNPTDNTRPPTTSPSPVPHHSHRPCPTRIQTCPDPRTDFEMPCMIDLAYSHHRTSRLEHTLLLLMPAC